MTTPTANEKLQDLFLRHKAHVVKVENGFVYRAEKALDSRYNAIERFFLKQYPPFPTSEEVKRTVASGRKSLSLRPSIARQTANQLADKLAQSLAGCNAYVKETLLDFIVQQAQVEADRLGNLLYLSIPRDARARIYASRGGIEESVAILQEQVDNPFHVPFPPKLTKKIIAAPFRGDTFAHRFASLGPQARSRLRQVLHRSISKGEHVRQAAKRIAPIVDGNRRRGLLIARTEIHRVSDEVRRRSSATNADVLKGHKHLSTFDGRTCEVCGALDSKYYPLGTEPPLPVHMCCRCCYVPVTKSWRELGIDADELTPGTRASMTGQVPAKLTYNDWLRQQKPEFVKSILGPRQYQRFVKGIDLPELVSAKSETLLQFAKPEILAKRTILDSHINDIMKSAIPEKTKKVYYRKAFRELAQQHGDDTVQSVKDITFLSADDFARLHPNVPGGVYFDKSSGTFFVNQRLSTKNALTALKQEFVAKVAGVVRPPLPPPPPTGVTGLLARKRAARVGYPEGFEQKVIGDELLGSEARKTLRKGLWDIDDAFPGLLKDVRQVEFLGSKDYLAVERISFGRKANTAAFWEPSKRRGVFNTRWWKGKERVEYIHHEVGGHGLKGFLEKQGANPDLFRAGSEVGIQSGKHFRNINNALKANDFGALKNRISSYAMTNLDEHFAESAELFFARPEVLRAKAPALFDAFEDLSRIMRKAAGRAEMPSLRYFTSEEMVKVSRAVTEARGAKTLAELSSTLQKAGISKKKVDAVEEAYVRWTGAGAREIRTAVSGKELEFRNLLTDIASNQTLESRTIYRGLHFSESELREFMVPFKAGNAGTLPQLQSFTNVAEVAEKYATTTLANPVKVVIHAPEGTAIPGMDISGMFGWAKEGEVLIPEGLKYRVRAVTDVVKSGFRGIQIDLDLLEAL